MSSHSPQAVVKVTVHKLDQWPHRVVFEDTNTKLGPLEVSEDADRVLVLRLDFPDGGHQLLQQPAAVSKTWGRQAKMGG